MAAHYAYWISTTLLVLLYFTSATLYVVKRSWVQKTLTELHYPAPYLVTLLIVVKLLGALTILSRFNVALCDLAYAGMFFHLLLSGAAHLGVHKPKAALPAVLGLVLLAVSFITQNVARDVPSPYNVTPATQQINR